MESLSSTQREIVLHTLQQIRDALLNLMEWNREVGCMDLLMATPGGMQKLAGNCMLIQAVGEGFKQIYRRTNGLLLPLRPEIPWRQVIGMRDRISHGYFEIDTEYVDDFIFNDAPPILEATDFFIQTLTAEA